MRQKSNSTPASSETLVRNIRRATRKHHAAEEKICIVLDGLRGETSIAELCRREGIAESMYLSGWRFAIFQRQLQDHWFKRIHYVVDLLGVGLGHTAGHTIKLRTCAAFERPAGTPSQWAAGSSFLGPMGGSSPDLERPPGRASGSSPSLVGGPQAPPP